jgi:succinyl-CoA synthetase beta subunit
VDLFEYQARDLLASHGVPVLPGGVAETPDQAEAIAREIAAPVVVKAQVKVGGRGKAGGVKLAASPEEAESVAAGILGMSIKGIVVRKVLVAAAADIVKELYLSAVLDRAARQILLMGSAEGGVEIEEVAAERPEAIVGIHADPLLGLEDWQARDLAFRMGLGAHLKAAVLVANGLVATMLA